MNVRCPQCQTVFRIDPEKVPSAGVRARCARCSAIFAISRSGVAATPRAAPAAALATLAAPAPPVPAAPPAAAEAMPPTPVAIPAPVPRPIPPMTPPAPVAPAVASPPVSRPSFMKQDPNARAQRLARALVSDIVAYNREKRDLAQAAGTLKTEFREEIRKSWEEYVAQVSLDLARSTPFFRDALNDILATGQAVF